MLQKKVWLIPERGPPGNCRANRPVFTHCKCWSRSQTSGSLLTLSLKNSWPRHTRGTSAGSTVKKITPGENWEREECNGIAWNAMQLLKAWHKPLCINVKGLSWWMHGGKARHWTVCTEWWHLHKTRLFKTIHTFNYGDPQRMDLGGGYTVYYTHRYIINFKSLQKEHIHMLFVCDQSLSCVRLCDPMGCSPTGSSVHGIFQTRILEWVAISYSRGSSRPRDQTHISCSSCIGRWILYHYATWEIPYYLCNLKI